MTTAVVINAHAGWDVEVKSESVDNDGNVVEKHTKIVPKHTQDTLYIHQHLRIVSIVELPLNAS